MAEAPAFVICLNCETPCYTFDWADEKVSEAYCAACGNDDAEQFATEEDLEAMSGDRVERE